MTKISGVTRRKRTQPKAESIRAFAIKPPNPSTNIIVSTWNFDVRGDSLLGFMWGFRAVEAANSFKFTQPIYYHAVGFSATEGG